MGVEQKSQNKGQNNQRKVKSDSATRDNWKEKDTWMDGWGMWRGLEIIYCLGQPWRKRKTGRGQEALLPLITLNEIDYGVNTITLYYNVKLGIFPVNNKTKTKFQEFHSVVRAI